MKGIAPHSAFLPTFEDGMHPLYFTVGPSQIHPAFASFFQEAMQSDVGSIYHRSEAFRAIGKAGFDNVWHGVANDRTFIVERFFSAG